MISGVIFTALKSLVDGGVDASPRYRCFPNTFPQAPLPRWPAIRFTLVSSVASADACGTDDGATDDQRWQVDCVDLTYGGARALRDGVVAAMMNLDPPFVRDGESESYDQETKTHVATIDFIAEPSSA